MGSISHSSGWPCCREYSLTCATLVSATSRVYMPHSPFPCWCTVSMICVAFSLSMVKNVCNILMTKSMGV